MAGNAASYVLMAPPEYRGDATASVAEGFRDACIEYGIPIEPGDLASSELAMLDRLVAADERCDCSRCRGDWARGYDVRFTLG